MARIQAYVAPTSATLPDSLPAFWSDYGQRFATVALPSPRTVARLTAYERATARLLIIEATTPPPPSQLGEALTRLRLWERDRGLRFYSLNRLALHLQQAMARPAHPAGWRLARHGWSLLAALDAADLAVIELTTDDTRERVRLSARLAELEGRAA